MRLNIVHCSVLGEEYLNTQSAHQFAACGWYNSRRTPGDLRMRRRRASSAS